jgi:DNA-binding MarR family transcriptional regulator
MLRGPLKPTAVAEALAVERSTISRNLSLMEQNGWIMVESSPSRRAVSVALTDKGMAILAEARTAWAPAQTHVVDLLGSDSPATIDAWLAALAGS